MPKEWEDQHNNDDFSVVKGSTVPKHKTIFSTVWQMRRKRAIKTHEAKKHKAWLNADGLQMKQEVDCGLSHPPAASWNSV